MSYYDRYKGLKYGAVIILILALLAGGGYFLLRGPGDTTEEIQDLRLQQIELYKKLLETDPKNTGILVKIGSLYKDMGELDKAIEYFKKAVAIEPDNPENFKNLIQAFDVSGDIDSAIGAAQNAIEHFQTQRRPQDVENFNNYLQQLQAQKENRK